MLSLIVAISDDYAIGHDGDLLCHLPNDLRHFKAVTLGAPVLMGSRTYLSLPRRPLPGRRNIVLTTQANASFEGAEIAHSLSDALAMTAGEQEVFIIGGGEVYRQTLPLADKLYITHIHHRWPEADTRFPAIDPAEWELISEERHDADDRHPYPYTFAEYIPVTPQNNR